MKSEAGLTSTEAGLLRGTLIGFLFLPVNILGGRGHGQCSSATHNHSHYVHHFYSHHQPGPSFFPYGAGSRSCLVLRPPNGPNARPQDNIHSHYVHHFYSHHQPGPSFFPYGAGTRSCLVLRPPNGPNARPQDIYTLHKGKSKKLLRAKHHLRKL